MNPGTSGLTGGSTNGDAVKIIIGAWTSLLENICINSISPCCLRPFSRLGALRTYVADRAACHPVNCAAIIPAIRLTCNGQRRTAGNLIEEACHQHGGNILTNGAQYLIKQGSVCRASFASFEAWRPGACTLFWTRKRSRLTSQTKKNTKEMT